MDSPLLFSFYYFVCLSGYLKSCEKSWSALQSSHCSSATDADHKAKANTKTTPTQNPFFFSQGREGKHVHTSPSCSSSVLLERTPSQHRARCLGLGRNMGAPALCDYKALYSLDGICSWGSVRETQENISHPQENPWVLAQAVPPPLMLRCPFLRATAGSDSSVFDGVGIAHMGIGARFPNHLVE